MKLFGSSSAPDGEGKNFSYSEESYNNIIRIDLADDDDYYYIYVDVPGKNIDDIKMKFKGSDLYLKIEEESEYSNPISNKSCTIQERIHDECDRLIPLEDPVDKKSVEASLDNGLLTVIIKKINPESENEDDLIQITSK